MSIMQSTCCCSPSCLTDCCDFWSCSPTSGTFTISASSSKTRNISVSGQTMTVETISWSINASLTRVGTGCSTYRLKADTCNFSYSKTSRVYWLGKPYTHFQALGIFVEGIGFVPCEPPPPPYDATCRWNCNSDGTCDTPIEFRLLEQRDYSYMATISGAPTAPFTRQLHNSSWVPGSVITISCIADCESDCVRPILLFAPGSHSSASGLETDEIVDPCMCADFVANGLPCLTNWTGYTFTPDPFAVIGEPGCLNSLSFDNPKTTSGGFPSECPWCDASGCDNPSDDMLGNGSCNSTFCSSLNRTFATKYCESPQANNDNLKRCSIIDNCFDLNLIDNCYWQDWCEYDSTTITWTSSIV